MPITDFQDAPTIKRRTSCPNCGQPTAVMLEVKVIESKSNARSGTTSTRCRTLCESCAMPIYQRWAEELAAIGT